MDRTESPGILPDFLIEKNSGGRIERSICCIETVAAITEDIVRRIEHYSLMLSGKDIAVLERILAVPTGTDTKLVPRGYSILHLPVPRPA
ncbi:MAG: hypothetical protein GKC04_01365 [Methanomicrobiales archaeon]|nr:hypothetical protein [Methanomicrobiales archaeon]